MQSETIHSYIRLKPEQGEPILHIQEDNQTISIWYQYYYIERAFGVKDSNSDIYEHVGSGLIKNAIDGYNCCIFAYGQTSSGKTHTIRGSATQQGLIRLALKDIFQYDASKLQINVTINYMQIYNETINDLLNSQNTNLSIRDNGNKNIVIDKLTDLQCKTLKEALDCLQKGQTNRKYGSTEMNGQSSRSHCIFRIILKVKQRNQSPKTSLINIIDLAGSECVSKTKAEGLVKKEGDNINKSLLFLSNAIRSLGLKEYVNYRDSKLTRILQSSLSGNCKTSVICTVNSLASNSAETINTLKFGVSAGRVKVKPKINYQRRTTYSPTSGKSSSASKSLQSAQKDKQNGIYSKNNRMLRQQKAKQSQLQDQNSQLQKIIDRQSKDIQLLNINLSQIKYQKSNRDENISQLLASNKKQKDQIQQLILKLSKMQDQVKKHKTQNQELKHKIYKLQHQNEIHLRNKQGYQKSITKMNKEIIDIQTSNKAEKRKMAMFKQNLQSQQTPIELKAFMQHTIQILSKNKQIYHLKQRVIFLQGQLSLKQQDIQLNQQQKVEKISRRKIKKMKNSYDHAKLQDKKNTKVLRTCQERIASLEKQLLEYRMSQELNKSSGERVIKYLDQNI